METLQANNCTASKEICVAAGTLLKKSFVIAKANIPHIFDTNDTQQLDLKIKGPKSWPIDSAGWSLVPYTKRLWVQSPVKTHT